VTKVKICGITNFQDASEACMLGADFLGFNFYKNSKRKVSLKMAADIISKLPPVFSPVGIFVDEEMAVIAQTAKKCNLKLVQLHGRETPEYCTELVAKLQPLGVKIIKAFRVKGEGTLGYIARFKDIADYFLLDAYVEGEPGGTGVAMNTPLPQTVEDAQPAAENAAENPQDVSQDALELQDNTSSEETETGVKPAVSGWDIAIEAKRYNKPIFLAGGLTPENVEEAIEKVLPFAVDVASGVERLRRRKDYEKVKKFITSSKAF